LRSHHPGLIYSILFVMVDGQRQMADGLLPVSPPPCSFAITRHPWRPTQRPAICRGLPGISGPHHERKKQDMAQGLGRGVGAASWYVGCPSTRTVSISTKLIWAELHLFLPGLDMDSFIRRRDQYPRGLPASVWRASLLLCPASRQGHAVQCCQRA
jgi:hypothetical protein